MLSNGFSPLVTRFYGMDCESSSILLKVVFNYRHFVVVLVVLLVYL